MPRFELTLDAKYLEGSWGAFQGVRELVQNARDAELQFHAPMEITHYPNGKGQLRINNEGATLKREAMLLGNTGKANRQDLIGQWGEGLKVGILALLRDGYFVKIRTGSEVWIPSIEWSEKFEAQVLVFNLSVGRKPANRVRVEISPFSTEDWETWKPMFLFLEDNKRKSPENRVETCYGTLLLDPLYKGRVFVKGIATEHIPELEYGYNLLTADLDRDRKMVSRWDLDFSLGRIWSAALSRRPDLLDTSFRLLQSEGQLEASALGRYLEIDAREMITEKFKTTFGEKALPVASTGDSAKLEHAGALGVVTPRPMRELLEKVLGTTEENLARLHRESRKLFSWHELDSEEKSNLLRAVKLVSHEEPQLSLGHIQITEFGDPALEGTFQWQETGFLIRLSRKILSRREDTLRVVLHEAAHISGKDGEKAHVQRIEFMWSSILERELHSAN